VTRLLPGDSTPGVWALLVLIPAFAILAAVLMPSSGRTRYRAIAVFELRRARAGADIQAVMERRLAEVRRRIPDRYSRDVTVDTVPESPRVQVGVIARTGRLAADSANNYAADLLSADLGIDREAIIRRKRNLLTRIQRLPKRSAMRLALEREIARLTRQQVSDAEFLAAPSGVRIAGHNRLMSSLAAGAIGLLVALAALAVLERLGAPTLSD
jgi:hypothetical protein